MAKSKLFCAFVAELLLNNRNTVEEEKEVEIDNQFVLLSTSENTITVVVEDEEFGLVQYDIEFKENLTVREVTHFTENDLAKNIAVKAKNLVTNKKLYQGTLYPDMIDSKVKIIGPKEGMDYFKYLILVYTAWALNIHGCEDCAVIKKTI